jgi:hypothetical protein
LKCLDWNVFWHFWNFLHEVNYAFTHVLVLRNVLTWLFPLVVVTTSFRNVVELFIVIFLFLKKDSGRLFA